MDDTPPIAVRDLLNKLEAAAEAETANQPHILLETDPETGRRQAFGPYPDAYAAVVAIAARREEWVREVGDPMAVWEPVLFIPEGG